MPGGVPAGGRADIYVLYGTPGVEPSLIAANISVDPRLYSLPSLETFNIPVGDGYSIMVEPTKDSSVAWSYYGSPKFSVTT